MQKRNKTKQNKEGINPELFKLYNKLSFLSPHISNCLRGIINSSHRFDLTAFSYDLDLGPDYKQFIKEAHLNFFSKTNLVDNRLPTNLALENMGNYFLYALCRGYASKFIGRHPFSSIRPFLRIESSEHTNVASTAKMCISSETFKSDWVLKNKQFDCLSSNADYAKIGYDFLYLYYLDSSITDLAVVTSDKRTTISDKLSSSLKKFNSLFGGNEISFDAITGSYLDWYCNKIINPVLSAPSDVTSNRSFVFVQKDNQQIAKSKKFYSTKSYPTVGIGTIGEKKSNTRNTVLNLLTEESAEKLVQLSGLLQVKESSYYHNLLIWKADITKFENRSLILLGFVLRSIMNVIDDKKNTLGMFIDKALEFKVPWDCNGIVDDHLVTNLITSNGNFAFVDRDCVNSPLQRELNSDSLSSEATKSSSLSDWLSGYSDYRNDNSKLSNIVSYGSNRLNKATGLIIDSLLIIDRNVQPNIAEKKTSMPALDLSAWKEKITSNPLLILSVIRGGPINTMLTSSVKQLAVNYYNTYFNKSKKNDTANATIQTNLVLDILYENRDSAIVSELSYSENKECSGVNLFDDNQSSVLPESPWFLLNDSEKFKIFLNKPKMYK